MNDNITHGHMVGSVDFLTAGDLAIGDIVEFTSIPKYAGLPFRVTKKMAKNVQVENENGGVVRADPFLLTRSDKPFNRNEGPALILGALVRLKPRNAGRWGDTLFVVVDGPKGGKVRLAKVGGDAGRWLPGVPVAAVDVLDAAEVLR